MHKEYLEQLVNCLINVEITENNNIDKKNPFESAIEGIVTCFINIKLNNNKIFFIGNGGSASIATHMTTDFLKNGGVRTQSLYDSSLITCIGNDYGYECIFSKPLELLFEKGDLLVAISSSGNSSNIVNAIEVVKAKNGKVITFSGFKEDNKIRTLGNYNIYVPISHYGIVESIHNLLLQQIVDSILDRDGIGLK